LKYLPHLSQPQNRRHREVEESSGRKQEHENDINQGSKDTSENELLFNELSNKLLFK